MATSNLKFLSIFFMADLIFWFVNLLSEF